MTKLYEMVTALLVGDNELAKRCLSEVLSTKAGIVINEVKNMHREGNQWVFSVGDTSLHDVLSEVITKFTRAFSDMENFDDTARENVSRVNVNAVQQYMASRHGNDISKEDIVKYAPFVLGKIKEIANEYTSQRKKNPGDEMPIDKQRNRDGDSIPVNKQVNRGNI